jgi:molybdopterin-guanine dinucleotide biosynthesis protein A
MTRAASRVGAIVLAGGRSSRFGRDKLAEPVDGRPMLDLSIDAVRGLASDVIVVVAPDGDRDLPGDVRVVRDARPFDGPLAGLATGLAAVDPAVDRVLVAGGDMPALVPAVLARLLDALDLHELAVLADDAGPRPLPMAARPDAARAAADRLLAGGERRLRALLGELEVRVIVPAVWRVDDPTGETLRDVDVPDDLPG